MANVITFPVHAGSSGRCTRLGVLPLTALVVGSMIGGGVFSLPQNMAKGASPAAVLIGWLISGVGILALALVYRNLAVRKPEFNAGPYSYSRAGFGDFVNFNSAWGYWLSAWHEFAEAGRPSLGSLIDAFLQRNGRLPRDARGHSAWRKRAAEARRSRDAGPPAPECEAGRRSDRPDCGRRERGGRHRGGTVICAGGGGIPVVRREDGSHIGVEAAVDLDHSSALLARAIGAGALLLLTDVDGGGAFAGIGRLEDATSIPARRAGTIIAARRPG